MKNQILNVLVGQTDREAAKLGEMFRPAMPEDFRLPLRVTNEPELHSYPSVAIKTADFDGEGAGYRVAVCMDLVPESVAQFMVRATNQHDALVGALAQAQQMLMEVACQPSDRMPEQLRSNLRNAALAAQNVLREATEA